MNKVLLILLIGALVATGAVTWRGSQDLRAAKAALEEYQKELKEIREKLSEVNIKYRGVTESLAAIPDSLKKDLTGEYMRNERKYRKILLGYEKRQREAQRMEDKRERQLAEVRKQFYRRLLLTGGLAVVLAGALLVRRTIRS
jgi:hypothetical protein